MKHTAKKHPLMKVQVIGTFVFLFAIILHPISAYAQLQPTGHIDEFPLSTSNA